MIKPSLKLVHNSDDKTSSERVAGEWFTQNASQLPLFDDEKNHILMVALDGMNSSKFKGLLESKKPLIIIDTRSFPDFYSIYNSLRDAFDEFKHLEIQYFHAPMKLAKIVDAEVASSVRENIVEALLKTSEMIKSKGQMTFLLTQNEDNKKKIFNGFSSLKELHDDWDAVM